jgi:hypothetical protein
MSTKKATATKKTTIAKNVIPKKISKSREVPKFFLGQDPETREINVTPELYDEFDTGALHMRDVVKSEFKVGKNPVTNYNSEWFFLDPEDQVEKKFYFYGPTQTTFAPSYQYPMGKDDSSKETEADKKQGMDPKERKGIQINYPLTSLQTAENPTELEVSYMNFLNRLRLRAVDLAVKESKKKASIGGVPNAVKALIRDSQTRMDDEEDEEFEERKLNCVKPIYVPFEKKADGKNKPATMYVPLVTSGKGEKLACHTKFYVDQIPHSPLEFTGDIGNGEVKRAELGNPCFALERNWWGAHGKENPYATSLKIFLVDADWEEIEGGSISVPIPENRYFTGDVASWKPRERIVSFNDDSDQEEDVKVSPKKAKAKPKAKPVEEESSDEEIIKPKAKKTPSKKVEEDEEEEIPKPKSKKEPSKTKPKKVEEEDEEAEDEYEYVYE